MTRLPLPALGLLAAAALLAACTRTRRQELAPIERAPVGLEIVADGPWREVPVEAGEAFGGPAVERTQLTEAPKPAPPPKAPPVSQRTRPSLALLPRRYAAPAAGPEGRPAKSPEVQRRVRYLDHPTRIQAARITLYCPAALEPEVQLNGTTVEAKRPDRRIATGQARLLLRDLTLEGERITLRIRGEDPDVQITARGDVDFVTMQKGQVMRQEGVRALLITNEQVVPLR